MAKKSGTDLLKESNSRLKAGKIPIRIITQAKTDRLYLRATLPPKRSASKQYPHQQKISLGVYCNPAGIKRAEAEAQKLNHELMMGQFDWSNWQSKKHTQILTVGTWIAAFENDYFKRRERNPKSETTWDKDYRSPFKRLPQDSELTAEVLIETATSYPPDTRAGVRACTAYAALAKFANLTVNLRPWRETYRPKVKNEDVPTDALILEWEDRIPNPRWRNFYRLCATYGLRNHEAFYVDVEKLTIDPIVVVRDGKTGYRAGALPCPKDWWKDWFAGQDIALPELAAASNSHYGRVSSQYFKRLGLPFRIYDLRHAHAGRLALKGIDPGIAARSQGHSLKVHTQIYQNHLEGDRLRGLLNQL